ncbi:unnamed protein product [Absidia cylindrospora]
MKAYSSLKPLDIEKTISNLICKLVDLGEWARALEELRKFKQHLASIQRIQLDKYLTLNLATGSLVSGTPKSSSPSTSATESQRTFGTKFKEQQSSYPLSPSDAVSSRNKSVLTESPNQQRTMAMSSGTGQSQSSSSVPELVFVGGRPSFMSSWEEEMIQKYADLFTFPLDTTINDRNVILLVLAYQMNVIRSWCDMNDGSMIKYISILLDRPGNFIDWCKHLMTYDAVLAKKQFDLLQRHLTKIANRQGVFDDPLQAVSIQVLALRSSAYTDMISLRSLCDRFVRLGISYEKSGTQVKYDHLQKYCNDLLQALRPASQEPSDVDAYFVFCEYYAYVSRKAKSYAGAVYGFMSMIQLLDTTLNSTTKPDYYHIAYATHAKLSLCAVQMDQMTHHGSYTDMKSLFAGIDSSVQCLTNVIQRNDISNSSYIEQSLMKLCKSLHSFRHSSNRSWEAIHQLKSNNASSPSLSQSPELQTPPPLSNWDQHIIAMSSTLQQCSTIIPLNLVLAKKMGWFNRETKSMVSPTEMMLTFVDIMILLAKIQYNVKDENTYYQAYDFLATAEQLCSDYGFSAGYRWISATYYTLGAEMVTLDSLASAVYPLRKACSLLEKDSGRLNSDAGKLQIAKRYEVYGTCCQKNGDFESAVNAYRMALRRLPSSTIDVFATGAERMTISRLIEQQPFVPKLIDRYLRSSFNDHEQKSFSTEFMDLSAITPIQKCVLYECELKVLLILSSRLNLTKQQNWLINSLLHHYSATQYPIRRTRILLSKVRMIHANGLASDISIRSAIKLVLEAQELLSYKEYGYDSDLLTYRRHYLALTCSWLGILRRELNEISSKTFVTALHHWGRLLKKVNPLSSTVEMLKADLEQVCSQVDDLDSLYDHLRILADLFGLIGHSSLQINTLRLLLKLNNGLRDASVDHVSDSVIITTDIGRIYTDLGYSGKADLEFSKVKTILANYTSSKQAELYYMLMYSHHLSTMGNYEESQDNFNTAKSIWENSEESSTPNKSLRSMKQQALKSFMISDCHLIRSAISLYKESLDIAISDATSSYQVLSNFMKSTKKRTRTNAEENIFLVDNSRKTQDAKLPSSNDLLFKEYQWTIAMKMGICLQRLALLHMTRGTWRDAQYYLLQGRQLGERIKSSAMVYQFLVLLSDSYLRTGQFDKSRTSLETANEIQPKGPFYVREDARMKSAVANMDLNQNYLDQALESYNNVDELLQKLMDPVYIVTLEKLSESDEDFERQLAIARDVHSTESELLDANEYECQSLQAALEENAVYKALTLARKGMLTAAFKLLEVFEEHGAMEMKENLLKATSAHIRLMVVKNELKHHTNLAVMEHNVSILPSLRLVSQRSGQMTNRNKGAHALRLVRDGVTQALERILATHRKCARIEKAPIVEKLCYDAGSAMFLKNQASVGESILVNNYAALSAYYLEMAKSIGLRREMQSCLDQKLLTPLPSMMNDLSWPKRITNLADSDTPMEDVDNGRTPSPFLSERTKTHLMDIRDIYRQEHDLDDAEFQTYFIDILPPHWTVCSLTLDIDLQELYVAQYRAGEPPLVVKLPLNRGDERRRRRYPAGVNSGITYEQAIAELEDIIQLSDETIHSNKTTLLKKDVDDWWMTRSLLDTRLKKLLEQMDRSWIGGFKGLLSGRHQVYKQGLDSFRQSLRHILMENIYGSLAPATPTNKRVLDINDRILQLVLGLGTNSSDQDVEDIVYFLLACFESQEIPIDYSDVIIDNMVLQLQQIIKSYHEQAAVANVNTLERLPNEHIILIPDKHTQQFPLESLPSLRSQPVSRLPCISFLRDRILYGQSRKNSTRNQKHQETKRRQAMLDGSHMEEDDGEWQDIMIDASRAYFILNPSGDLKYTQAKFENVFAKMHTWEGQTQKKPSEMECRSVLLQKDLYMFFGHSAGQSLIRGQLIRQLPRCPVTLLMGCSSGALQSQGEYDPNGYVLNYLLGGSPAVVANLWDVTDKSIDQVSYRMMERWGIFDGAADSPARPEKTKSGANISVVEALSLSRDECQLPYLIGAASVVYGVPVYVL